MSTLTETLDEIEARAERARQPGGAGMAGLAMLSLHATDDIPRLVAAMRRAIADLEEVNRDVWYDEKGRLHVIARITDKTLAGLAAILSNPITP